MDLRRWRFLDKDRDDSRLLTEWREAPLTYRAGQIVPSAHTDHYEERMAAVADAAQFERVAERLLRYHFYLDDVMLHTSDFGLANRRMRVDDRIVQRIHVVRGLAGFAYATTDKHDETGQWSAQVQWRDDASVWLTVDSYGGPNVPWFAHGLARRTQLWAHQRGIAHFRQLIAS